MTAMDDLVTWLRAQLDEDERKVAAMEREEGRVQTAPIFQGHPPGWLAGVDIFVSSKRWRAEVEAKRRILDKVTQVLATASEHITVDSCDEDDAILAEGVLRLLALPHADRPGYREEWRP